MKFKCLSMAALAAALMLGTSLPASAEGAGAGGAESAAPQRHPGTYRPDGITRETFRNATPAERHEVRRSMARSGFYRHGGYAYYNGHRGYRSHRPGYRYHDGFWFPAAAFAVGALIGGAVASSPPPAAVISNPHVDWCRAHYRSYNPYDNTFQPYGGPRMVCRSPYG